MKPPWVLMRMAAASFFRRGGFRPAARSVIGRIELIDPASQVLVLRTSDPPRTWSCSWDERTAFNTGTEWGGPHVLKPGQNVAVVFEACQGLHTATRIDLKHVYEPLPLQARSAEPALVEDSFYAQKDSARG